MRSQSYKVRPRQLVALASALMFSYGFILGGQQLVMVDIASEYELGQSKMGFLVSAQHVAAVIMPICMGAVADKVGKKRVLVLFSLIFGIGCAFVGASASVWIYLVGTCLIGCGYSVCESLSSAVMTDLDEVQGMRYVNITQCLLSVGAIISPVLLKFCMGRLGANWRLGFWLCAAAFCLLAVLLAFTGFPGKAAVKAAKAGEKQKEEGYRNWQICLLLSLFVAIVLYVGLENGFGYFVNSLFTIQLGNAEFGAAALSAYWAGMALVRFLCGLRTYHPEKMLFVCFALSAVLFVALACSPWAYVSVLLCGCLGAAFGPIWSTLVALAAKVRPQNSAGAIGLMSTGCGLGGIVYPALMGVLSEAFSLRLAFLCLAATAFAGLILCMAAAGIRSGKEQA